MVKTLARLVLALISVVSASWTLELAGAAAVVAGVAMLSVPAACIVGGVLLMLKAAESS